MHVPHRSIRTALTSIAAGLVLVGCEPSTEVHDEPEVSVMRITIAGQAPVTVSSSGVASGTLALVNGVATAFTVEFLDDAMADALGEHADEFEASVTPAAGITFARTGSYAGTLTGTVDGPITVAFGLFHPEEAHNDFGPFNVTFNVAP
jgi:hypothetical protein